MAQVAPHYAVIANLIFKWLRVPRFASDPASALPPPEEARILPVVIVAETRSAPAAPAAENHIEIETAGGHRLRFRGGYDPEALACLIRGPSELTRFRPTRVSDWRPGRPTCARASRCFRHRPRRC